MRLSDAWLELYNLKVNPHPAEQRLEQNSRVSTQETALAEAPSSSLDSNPDVEVELVNRAFDVIGPDRLATWMRTPVPSLNGRTPYSLLGSEEGRRAVEAVLGRIEHGIY